MLIVQNWKKPQVRDGIKFYLPEGKHNLYRGAKLITYLSRSRDDGEESEHFNKIENIEMLTNNIASMLNLLKDPDYRDIAEKTIKKDIKALKEEIENIKNIVENSQ